MKTMNLTYIGEDDWSRPVYRDENDNLLKDTNLGEGPLALCTVHSGFNGEPDTPVEIMACYQNVTFEITGRETLPSSEQRFNYQLLSRLQSDCDYYLGYGGRQASQLWAGDEQKQIDKIKEIWEAFTEDEKPEWLTWGEILSYEQSMLHEMRT